MFFKGSRYADVGDHTIRDSKGREIRYKKIRFIPETKPETAHIVNDIARKRGYELRVFHVPKTIDNDLVETDHCPGYGSAARYVALAFMGNDLDCRALPGIKIDICMGRDAGWLTAAASLARQNPGDGPHLIYLPERAFDVNQFIRDVQRVYARYGRCLVTVSEGISDKDGVAIAAKFTKEVDAHGNVQLSGLGALLFDTLDVGLFNLRLCGAVA